jgi:hypothetical protein
MSLALKITYTQPGSTAGTSKVIKFAPHMSILEAAKGTQEKFTVGARITDFSNRPLKGNEPRDG